MGASTRMKGLIFFSAKDRGQSCGSRRSSPVRWHRTDSSPSRTASIFVALENSARRNVEFWGTGRWHGAGKEGSCRARLSVSRGAGTKRYKVGSSERQKFIPSHSRRLKVQNRGVGRTMLPRQARGEGPPASPRLWGPPSLLA